MCIDVAPPACDRSASCRRADRANNGCRESGSRDARSARPPKIARSRARCGALPSGARGDIIGSNTRIDQRDDRCENGAARARSVGRVPFGGARRPPRPLQPPPPSSEAEAVFAPRDGTRRAAPRCASACFGCAGAGLGVDASSAALASAAAVASGENRTWYLGHCCESESGGSGGDDDR